MAPVSSRGTAGLLATAAVPRHTPTSDAWGLPSPRPHCRSLVSVRAIVAIPVGVRWRLSVAPMCIS